MKKTLLMLGGLLLATALTVGLIENQTVKAQQDPVKRTVLFKTDLEGAQGKEINLIMVELTPGAESGKHYHPGDEIGYVVSGSATLEIEGKKPTAVKSGSVLHLTPKQVHNVRNAGKAPLKVVVLGIYAKGEPVATPVK